MHNYAYMNTKPVRPPSQKLKVRKLSEFSKILRYCYQNHSEDNSLSDVLSENEEFSGVRHVSDELRALLRRYANNEKGLNTFLQRSNKLQI